MKKTLLVAISLILVSLFLVVGCDDKANNVSDNSGNGVSTTITADDLKPIVKDPVPPVEADYKLFEVISTDFTDFCFVKDESGSKTPSEAVTRIAYDLVDAFLKKGMTLETDKISLSVSGDLDINKESGSLAVEVKFSDFEFADLSFNGTLKASFDVEVGDWSYSGTSIQIKEDGAVYIGNAGMYALTKYFETTYATDEAKKNLMEGLVSALIEQFPSILNALNVAFEDYSLTTDFLSIHSYGKGTIGNDLFSLETKDSIATRKPIEVNGSKYMLSMIVEANVQIAPSTNPDPETPLGMIEIVGDSGYSASLVIVTSGKVGNNKIRLYETSDVNSKTSLIEINGKVMDLKEVLGE